MSSLTLTEQLADVLQQHGWMLATAESQLHRLVWL
jgi:hypothetical protein